MTKRTCTFTGHHPQKMPYIIDETDERCLRIKERLKEEIELLIKEKGTTHFISGMALGIDIYAAEIVLELKKQYPNVTLEAVIPFEEQANKWKEADRERYYTILEKCDKESMLQKHYSSDCMLKKDHYMVDEADVIIAVWDGSQSEAGKTVSYATSQAKSVIVINPNHI